MSRAVSLLTVIEMKFYRRSVSKITIKLLLLAGLHRTAENRKNIYRLHLRESKVYSVRSGNFSSKLDSCGYYVASFSFCV